MTPEEAREVAHNPAGQPLSTLLGALAALGREVDRREAADLEQVRLRAQIREDLRQTVLDGTRAR